MSQPQNVNELSAKLLEAQRILFPFNGAGQTATASVLTKLVGATALVEPLVANEVWRFRLKAGSVSIDGAHQNAVSLESAGLQIIVQDASHLPLVTLVQPAIFGALTALAHGAGFNSDWIEMRADDWALTASILTGAAKFYNANWILVVNNTAGTDATVTVQAVLEAERFKYDTYDLPTPAR